MVPRSRYQYEGQAWKEEERRVRVCEGGGTGHDPLDLERRLAKKLSSEPAAEANQFAPRDPCHPCWKLV
jgi:hypothetical protein